jgi:general secretion pathway protein I
VGEAGFSLLEVLVAFAILSVSLGVLMQIFSQASRSTIVAADYSRAIAFAESRLQTVGVLIPLEEGVVPGDPDAGLVWEVSIREIELGNEFASAQGLAGDGEAESDMLPSAVPFRVDVTVLWNEGPRARRLTLSSLRLGERLFGDGF